MDENITAEQVAEVDAWLTEAGYADIGEWMRDSDYLLTPDEGWVDLDDNPVIAYEQAYFAMEADQSDGPGRDTPSPENSWGG